MIVIISVGLYKTNKFLTDFFKCEEQKSVWGACKMLRFKIQEFTYYSTLFCELILLYISTVRQRHSLSVN